LRRDREVHHKGAWLRGVKAGGLWVE
jgi:hypothetical protein